MIITALTLLRAIKTSEWHRYTAYLPDYNGYASAGTTGTDDAIEMRCLLPFDGPAVQPIEYRHVGCAAWRPTGYSACMRYDASRGPEDDGDGYTFIPYHVTQLQRITR